MVKVAMGIKSWGVMVNIQALPTILGGDNQNMLCVYLFHAHSEQYAHHIHSPDALAATPIKRF